MKKINQKKNKINYVIAFILPIAILLINFLLVGNNYILNSPDVVDQYIPFFNSLKRLYLLNDSIFYNFNFGLGNNFFTLFFYYLSSPLNILVMLFKNVENFILVISLLKIGLCGLNMFIFLSNKQKSSFNLIFSLCYALMGYNVIYIGNVFWLDVVFMTPIVLIGIDNIIYKNNSKLYIISLAFSIFFNFYISFSLCIFSTLYLFFEIFYKNIKNKIMIIIKFFKSSIFVGLVCSFFLIPILYDLINSTNRMINFKFINDDFINLFQYIYKFLVGSSSFERFNIIEFYHMPNIYVSIFVLLLNLFLFFDKNISKKQKSIILFVYLFFSLSMIFQPLYSMWHGFTEPIGFEYRFSYVWSFMYIYIASIYINEHKCFDKKEKKHIISLIIILIYFITIIYFFRSNLFIENGLEFISIIFIIIYSVFLFQKEYNLLIFVIIIEMILNIYICTDSETQENRIDMENKCLIANNEFFRTNIDKTNNAFYCDYGSISIFSSTINSKYDDFFKKMGLNVSQNHVRQYGYGTDIIDSLFSIRYYIDKELGIYENKNILSIGYMINYDNILYSDNPIENQENILNVMINKKWNYFEEYGIKKIDTTNFSFKNNNKDKYLLIKNIDFLPIDLTLNKFNSQKDIFLTNVIYSDVIIKILDETKDEILLGIDCGKTKKCLNKEIMLYEFNQENFKKSINILSKQQLKIDKINKNRLIGNINVLNDGQYLFLSIPYDKSWNIYVDDKKVEYEMLFDNFIGVKLNKGAHNIEMIYIPKGLRLGNFISFFTIFVYFIYNKFNKKSRT